MRKLFQFAGRKMASTIPAQAPDPGSSLKRTPVPELKDAQLAALYYEQRTGGDLHDFLRVSPTRVLFGLVDVAGHIDENREIVAAARDTFRSAAVELFAQDDLNEAEAMIELCVQLNRRILNTAGQARSSPAFAGCYNENLGTVCYVNAGHTPGLMMSRSKDDSGISELPATGLPLGLFSHSAADASIIALQPGSVLAVVSRGVIEARSRAEEFGLERVRTVLQHNSAHIAQEICAAILNAVQKFTLATPANNDRTVLALARSEKPDHP